MTKFSAILSDPPWSFKVWSNKGKDRSAENHYPVMTLQQIKDLDVPSVCKPDCCLFLWVTNPMLKQGIDVLESWGMTYKTVAFTWVKTNKTKLGFSMGLGYWSRANAEMCLLGTIGHPKRKQKNVHSLIVSQRREHSRKPEEVYGRIERLVDGPYLEMFARHRRNGWACWGNEVTGDLRLEDV